MEALSFATVIDGIGRLARGVERAVQQVPRGPSLNPVSDAGGTRNAVTTDLGTTSRVEYGYVVDAIPGLREYRVLPEAGGPMIECCGLLHSAGGAMGVYDATTYMSGTHVRYIRHRQTPMSGVIIGAEPSYHTDPTLYYGDIVSQGSNTGILLETGYHALLKFGSAQGHIPVNGGLTNFGGRSPWDSLEGGELNYSTETGLMIHLDPYMGFLRADEMTGIWVFYWDGLTRIAGQNLQEITSVSTREVYDDEGEASVYRGVATYPWENRGMLINPNDSLTSELNATQAQTASPSRGRLEPANDDQQAYHRFQTYEGYLGQAQKKVVSVPNLNSGYSTNVLRYSDSYKLAGLHDSQVTMAGHYFVRNALGLTLTKRPIIPVPKRVKPVTNYSPTSSGGDGHGNYKASSLYTDGAAGLRDHKVQPTPTPASVATGEEMLHTATAVLDLHAHMFNWEGLHPFYYHKNDYYIPEESAYTSPYVTTNQEIPTWTQLDSTSQWYLSPASSVSIKLDHRTGGTAKVYKNTSYVTLLDDGGVLIGGGCGEEIRMAGGDIFLSCPGDVFMEAGRNVLAWGGRDVCLRAWNAVDISANKRDVRIKAEQHMQLLSANGGGQYGTLIECRSSGPAVYDFTAQGEDTKFAGIILRSLQTEICQYADNIYLRTCVPSPTTQFSGHSTTPTIKKHGDITLDCHCCGDITTRSKNIKHWVCCAIAHSFDLDDADNDSEGANMFTANGTTLCKDLFSYGAIIAWNDVVAGDNVIAGTGNMYSQTGGGIAELTSAATTSIINAIDAGQTYELSLQTWMNSEYVNDFDSQWYAYGRPGNDDNIHSHWASLRTDTNYKSSAFTLYESRWAQMARAASPGAPTTWTENKVLTNAVSTDTYPFPGGSRLTSSSGYKKHQFLLYDTTNQYAKDRATTSTSSVYEAPVTLTGPTYVKIDGNYPIIGRS